MEKTEKVFMTQQLICMLPSLCVKTLGYLINWQKYEVIKYYPNQMTKFMHITEKELEIALQTLSDRNLIDISKIDGNYAIQLNKNVIMSYINVPMQKVHDTEGFKLADKVTWNIEEKTTMPSYLYGSLPVEDMDEKQIQAMILRLQASLNEKKQVKELVKSNEVVDDLPF